MITSGIGESVERASRDEVTVGHDKMVYRGRRGDTRRWCGVVRVVASSRSLELPRTCGRLGDCGGWLGGGKVAELKSRAASLGGGDVVGADAFVGLEIGRWPSDGRGRNIPSYSLQTAAAEAARVTPKLQG